MAKRRYEADYVLNLNKTIASLQNAKKQAEAFDDIMSSIGDRGNLNELIKHFLNLDNRVDDLRQSTNELMSDLGDSLKGGYIKSLDAVFDKLAMISKMSGNLFSSIGDFDLSDTDAPDKLMNMAKQLNEIFDSFGIQGKIDLDNFSTKSVEEQYKRLGQLMKTLNKDINTTLNNINVGNIRSELNGATVDIKKMTTMLKKLDDLMEERNSWGDGFEFVNKKQYDEANKKVQALKQEFIELFNITDKDLLEDLEYLGAGDEDLLKEHIERFKQYVMTSGNAVQESVKVAGAFDKVGKHTVEATEYIKGMTFALKELFDVMSKPMDTEYKILINGQDINIKKGQFEEIDTKTLAEAYLSNLDQDTTVSAHSHMGRSSHSNQFDFRNAIDDYYLKGSQISAIIGKDDIATFNLAGVALEDAEIALKKIEEHVRKFGSADVKSINKIFQSINSKYTDVAKSWKPEQFEDFAKYIYALGETSELALTPVERFQNVLRMFSKNVDLSKYKALIDTVTEQNAGNIFNQIMRSENIKNSDGKLLQVDNIKKGTLTDVINDIKAQQEQYVKLREEAKVTYQDIASAAQKYLDTRHKKDKDDSFLKQYFSASELTEIDKMFEDIAFGERDLTGVTNAIASRFGIDIDDMPIAQLNQVGDSAVDASEKLKAFYDLIEEIKNTNFYGSSDNVEIGKYTERLDVAKQELDELGAQGLITADELKAVNDAFDESKIRLDDQTVGYTGYGSGYYYHTYRDEYDEATQENEELKEKNALLEQNNALLQEEAVKKQELLDDARAERDVIQEQLDSEIVLSQEIAERAIQAEIRAEKEKDRVDELTRQNEELKEQLDLEKQIDAQEDVDDDELSDIQKENGALEDRLEVLRDIADMYGIQISQKDRNRYEELADKDNEDGLTSKEAERFDELGGKIDEADEKLSEFEETYERIVIKLSNGKKLEIFPDDKGLRDLYKISDEYGTYNGHEIEDIQFIRHEISSYEELVDLVERYNKLRDVKTKFTAKQNEENEYLVNKLSNATRGRLSETWDSNAHINLDKIAEMLDFKIPQAAAQSEQAVAEVAQAVSDIVYHAGDLSKIDQTLKSFRLGNVTPHKSGNVLNGFTGLYTTEDVDGFWANEWDGAPISSIDLSHYKMFDARNDDLAIKARDFFDNLNGTIYGYIEYFDSSTGEMLKNTNVKSVEDLYKDFKEVFHNVDMDLETFADFVKKSKAFIAGHSGFADIDLPAIDEGVAKSAQGVELQGVTQNVFDSDSFQTQLLKMLGFEGIDLRGTKFNGTYTGGTVVFDVKPESLQTVNEKWSDVMARNGYEIDEVSLQHEEKRRQLAFETAEAYSRATDEVREQNALFDTSTGQMALFEGMSDELQKAENNADGLKDTVKEISVLDDQISFDDLAVATSGGVTPPSISPVIEDAINNNIPDDLKTAAGGTTPPNDPNEMLEIDRLPEAVEKVTTAVNEKTSAFEREEEVVKSVVSSEVGQLDKLEEKLISVKNAVEDKNDTFSTSNIDTTKGVKDNGGSGAQKKSTQVDTRAASDRIADATIHKQISDIAISAVSGLGDVEIEGLTALKDGVVKVEGAFKNAEGTWEGFSVKVNKANEAVDLSVKKQSAFANALNKTNEVTQAVTNNTNKKAPSIKGAKNRYYGLANEANKFVDDNSNIYSADVKSSLDKYTDAITKLELAQKALINTENLTEQELKEKEKAFAVAQRECSTYASELKKLIDANKKFNSTHENVVGVEKGLYNLDEASERTRALTDYINEQYGATAKIVGFDEANKNLRFTIKDTDGSIKRLAASFDATGTAIGVAADKTKSAATIFDKIGAKAGQLLTYFSARLGIDELFQQVRKGIQYVKEIDSALTELKKVTDETDASYQRFLQSMSKTAGVIGSTVSELTTMAADWARLGYSMEEAGKLAESTAILLNVSEFTDANSASEALISTMQAFSYTADQSQHVVDILNEVGNNFAVSSDGIATALQDSASALMEGGNNLEQAVALVAAANKVVQDPNSVGSALRTISLRLRGTSVEVLEQMGEETDGVVESTSKLQAKIRALTGVDIVDMNGAYKDTYTILQEIGTVWEDMNDIDQAALLELMAGKNRANTLAAILGNMKDLEGAYQSALKAEGSALKENAAYLDSIQGRVDLFTNALQTFWMNFISSDTVKGVVDIGTAIIKILDTLYGKIIAVVGAIALYQKVKNKVAFTDMFKGIVNTAKTAVASIKTVVAATASLTKADIARALASKGVENGLTRRIIAEAGLKGVTASLTKEQIKATAVTLGKAYADKKLTTAQYLTAMSTMGLKTALQGLFNVLKQNPIYLVAAAVTALGFAIDKFTTTAQEAADAAQDAFEKMQSVVDSTKSAIQSLEDELSTLQDQINGLNGKSLSFADNEELRKLTAQREELEHSLKVQKQLLEVQQKSSNKQAVATMKAYTKAASQGADETTKTAKNIGTIAGGILTVAGIVASVLIPGDFGTIGAGAVAAGKAVATKGSLAAIAGSMYAGNKAGEWAGSKIAENEGTYDSWYETYTAALDKTREEEEKAFKAYQKDSSNINKLDKWQEAQQKAANIETEMYGHLSQMQQYYNGLEYGEGFDDELDAWYNFLDKLSIQEGASGAEVTALDRIFGENASEEIKDIKEQIVSAIKSGEDFDFGEAINSSQELRHTLQYVGLEVEQVKDYFTLVGEAAIAAEKAAEINPVDTYSAIIESVSKYNDLLAKTVEIVGDNTAVTQEYKDSLIELGISESELNTYFDENNKLVVKNAKGLKELVSQNVKLKKAQHQLDYYNLVKQLNATLNTTNQLDNATKDSISTLLDQIDTVEMAVYQYQLLEDSLLGATNAFDAFAKAQEVDDLNTYGDSYASMVQTMYDAMYKTGQVGTEAFEAAVRYLVPDSVYQGITDPEDSMKAIYDYFNKNILPTGKLDKDQFSLDYRSIENFVQDALDARVFSGNIDNFDLVDGMNLEKAAELMGHTKTQAYALFAELDKYNADIGALSLLSQLDDSLEGRITNTIHSIEELNRQKLLLLEDGGYEKNKEQIDAINSNLLECEASLDAAEQEAYSMWQAYSKNDAALNALSIVKDKQQQITEYSASTLGLDWNAVEGKTVQQIYDELLAKKQELGVPTELSVQFAKEHVDEELAELKTEIEAKGIDIAANVVWNTKDRKYEIVEGSQHINDETLQEYVTFQNEGYVLDNYFESGMTVTEGFLSDIKGILQDIYNYQTGNVEDTTPQDDGVAANTPSQDIPAEKSKFDEFSDSITNFFTETVPDVAGDISEELNRFFTETIPAQWNEFWTNVGNSFDVLGDQIEILYGIVSKFFTETLPQAWNEFWVGVGETFNDIKNDAIEIYDVISKFFKETVPQKWEEFWNGVEDFLTEEVPYAVGYAAGVLTKFFTVTIPEKWDEFWNNVGEFINEAIDDVEAIYNVVSKFFTETIPEKWNELWENVGDFYDGVIVPAITKVKNALNTFFTETLPAKWNEFWDDVENFFTTTIPTVAGDIKEAIVTFFTTTIPQKWNDLCDSITQFIEESVVPALVSIQNSLTTFFTETVPTKWNELLDGVSIFFTETVPTALQLLSDKITEFFTVVIPTKWSEFWTSIDEAFITPIQDGLAAIGQGITTFFTETLPNEINSIWGSVSSWIGEKASEIWSNLTAGFTAGFGGAGVNGTAHSSGTAHAKGTWGAPNTETALVGELGPEMVVRNGRWFTVGENGAEFTDIKKGDIIFNHKQTEDLLSKGYVAGRGKAYASGTAYNGLFNPTSPTKEQSNKPGTDFVEIGQALYDAADSLSDISDVTEDVVDFIEIKLDEIEAKISATTAKLENYADNTSRIDEKDVSYDDLVQAEIDKSQTFASAWAVYNAKAASILTTKIPKEYRAMAQNGAIAIEDFVGEDQTDLIDSINEYRQWAAKADSAESGYYESISARSAYRVDQLQDIATDYDNVVGLMEAKSSNIQANIDWLEASGERVGTEYYTQLIKNTGDVKAQLNLEKTSLQKILDDSVASGDVKEGTDEWYEMVNAINEVDEKIIQCDIDIAEFKNSIEDIKWDNLDKLMSRFDSINSELSHIYDRLTDNDDVVDDDGNWNSKGIAALGVAAQQMEVAEVKANQFANAIADLDQNWESLGYSQDEYDEKRAELLENQWKEIDSYESAKDAIVDLNKTRIDAVKDGMEKEIDAYKELIDKKKEALDADKDIYDFEKNVAKQEKDIASIRRKIAALSGDTSASATAQRKQLEAELLEAEAELADTYRDRSIDQQKEKLDTEYEQYEEHMNSEMETLDEYLKDEEKVILDSMNVVKKNTGTVLSEIDKISTQYGVKISSEITSPWTAGENAINSFSGKFNTFAEGFDTSVFTTKLNGIVTKYEDIQTAAENAAKAALKLIGGNTDDGGTGGGTGGNPGGGGTGGNAGGGTGGGTTPSGGTTSQNVSKGQTVTVSKDATNFSSKSGNATMASFVKGGSYTVMQTSGNQVLIGKGGTATGWVNKSDLVGYKSGTLGVKNSQWAWIDEIGEELVLHAGSDGKLSYLTKGTSVIPSDITTKLLDLVADPTQTLEASRPIISAPKIVNNEINIDMSFGSVVNIEHVDNDTLPDLTKAVEKQMDKYMKNLNNQIRKYAR